MEVKDTHIDTEEDFLDALENSGSPDCQERERLLADNGKLEDARLLADCRQAFIRRSPMVRPDAGRAWEEFRQKRMPRREGKRQLWLGVAVGIAASILLFVGWQLFFPTVSEHSQQGNIVALVASGQPQEVILTTSKGRAVSLSGSSADSVLQATGITREEEKLTYTQTSAEVEMHTLTVPRCSYYQLQLADGTEVWLNAESRLVYPNRFSGNRREVELQGEGYFKVAPDPLHPFIVKSGKIVTEVLGTEFNMRNYNEKDAHVTLLKGSVKVRNHISATEVVIRPGEDAFLLADGTFEVREVDTDHYYLWTEGYFYFDNEPVVDIVCELGRWYNMQVEFQNSASMHYRLHFLAERDRPVEEALQLLNMLGKVKAVQEGNKIIVR